MKVMANQGWQDTGVRPGAKRGEGPWLVIRAEGSWFCRTDDRRRGERDADGRTPNSGAQDFASSSTKDDKRYPYRADDAHTGMLIGKLGHDGEPFRVGKWCKVSTESCDPGASLMLSMNENEGGFGDNEGALDVTIKVTDLSMPDPRAESAARIAAWEKQSGKTYRPG